MKKYIMIEWIQKGPKYLLQITNQSHRQEYFGDNKRDFDCKNIILSSQSCPEWIRGENILYTRGDSDGYDNQKLEISSSDLEKIIKGVNEYNIYFESSEIQYIFGEETTRTNLFKIELAKDLFEWET
jgi:hypothetical protein